MTHPSIDSQITFLYTDDLAASTEFYERVLGLKLWRDQTTCRIYHLSGDAYIGVCQRSETSPAVNTDSIIFTIVTDAVDAWYVVLRERGVVFEKPPAENPTYQIYHCFLRDPNGYLIEIQRFL